MHRDCVADLAKTARLGGGVRLATTRSLPRHVVLLDDVMTTGATLEAAARTLHHAGVARVDAWGAARAV